MRRERLKALADGHDWARIGHRTAESASAPGPSRTAPVHMDRHRLARAPRDDPAPGMPATGVPSAISSGRP